MMKTNKTYPLEEYRNQILTIWNVKTKHKADTSAYLIYGKFLNFLDKEDFSGAKLCKQFLRIGKVNCRIEWPKNKFKDYYSKASKSEKYLTLKKEFFFPCKRKLIKA